MATARSVGVGISTFISGSGVDKLKLSSRGRQPPLYGWKRRRRNLSVAVASLEQLFIGVGVGLPCTVMECGDIIYRSTLPRSDALTITIPGVTLALAAVSYLWATPGVAPGFWDMFVLAFFDRLLRPTFRKDDLLLGKKLGEGAFGVVYKVSSPAAKIKEDLVLKKATEYGAVEIWMNERVRRACASSCAYFLYGFREGSAKSKGVGGAEYWLIWRFEGEDTLADLMLSKEFPYNMILSCTVWIRGVYSIIQVRSRITLLGDVPVGNSYHHYQHQLRSLSQPFRCKNPPSNDKVEFITVNGAYAMEF